MPQRKKHPSARQRRNKASTAATLTVAQPTDRSGWTLKALREEIDDRNADIPDGEQLISKAGSKAALVARLLEDDRDLPELPERDLMWHKATMKWWADVWSSPMADEWHPSTDYHNVLMAAMHYDDMMRAGTAKDRQAAHASYLRMIAPLGLTPYDRRRLEWQIESAEEMKDRGQKRRDRESKSPTPQPKPAEDPRLRLVGDAKK